MSCVALKLYANSRILSPNTYTASHWASIDGSDFLVHIVSNVFVPIDGDGSHNGDDPSDNYSPIWIERRTDVADPSTATWNPLILQGEWAETLVGEARPSQCGTAIVGRHLVIVGNGAMLFQVAFLVDLVTGDVRINRVDTPLAWHAMSTVGVPARYKSRCGDLLCFGGGSFDGSATNQLTRLRILESGVDVAAVPNVEGAVAPPSRLYHGAVIVRERYMYTFGGAPDAKTTTGDDVVYADLWALDLETVTWNEVKQRSPQSLWPSKRGSYAMHFFDPYVYMVGGFDGVNHIFEVWRFHVDLQRWEEVGVDGPDDASAVVGRWGVASVVNPRTKAIESFGGFDGNHTPVAQRWSLTVPTSQTSLKLLVALYLATHRDKFNEEELGRVDHLWNYL